jgi:hypothetical protein
MNSNYGQSAPGASVASGGIAAPTPSGGQAAPPEQPQTWTSPDAVPALDDPTTRPDEPLTHGMDIGPGAGREALGLGDAQAGLRRLGQANQAYFGYLAGRTDLPDRVAQFVRLVRNSP